MRHTLSLLLLLGMFLQGCGQKGPLYLPEEGDEAAAAQAKAVQP